jgi:outer membrane receptor for ferrienterochelin and colicins
MQKRHRFALLSFLALGSAAPARADEVGSILEVLEENVVTGASRSAERAGDAPATSTTITAEQLRRYGIRRLDEALNYLSLGMFAHDRMSTAEVGARGVAVSRDSNGHVLVVLDGVIVNEQGGGAAFLHDIPLDVVDHIEVILGPGSVLYGAQAMLGVINIVTKSSKDYDGYHAVTSFGFSPPLDSNGNVQGPRGFSSLGYENHYSLGVGRSFELFGETGGVIAEVDLRDFKGPHMSFERQALPGADLGPHAEPGQWGGPVEEQWFSRTLGAYTAVELGGLSFTTRAALTELAMPQMDLFESRAPAAYDDAHNRNAYTLWLSNLRYDERLTPNLTAMARVYFGYSERNNSRFVVGHDARLQGVPLGVVDPEQCPLGPTGPCRKEANFFSRWTGLELQSTYDWFGDGAYTTLVGADGRLRTAAYEFVTFDDGSGLSYGSDPALTRWHAGGHDQADEHAVGAYLQQTLRPWKFLAVNAGVRADFDSRMRGNEAADAISPRAALIGTPNDNLSLKLIYSKAFRAPSFLEQRIVNGRLLPNPDGLDAETVSSFEAASTLRVRGHALTLSGFYADWSNLIELQILNAQAPAASRFENVADIKNYGAGLSYDGSFLDGKLRAGLNSMLAESRRLLSDEQVARNAAYGVGDDVPLAVAPRIYGNAHADYTFAEDTAVAVAAGFMGRRIADQAYFAGDVSNLSPRPEAPAGLELRLALTGSIPGARSVSYTLGGNYSFASRQPFVVGPNQGQPRYLVDTQVPAELALVNRLTVFTGLEFDIDSAVEVPTAASEPRARRKF